MPFILRRTKAQVLQDLPPKIVTDVLCKMSSIQQRLYEDFASSQVGVRGGVWECYVRLMHSVVHGARCTRLAPFQLTYTLVGMQLCDQR
jgi:SNF2 family DNA or RNA helicase